MPPSSLLRPAVPMDIPGGANPAPCAQPRPCTGRGKISMAQWLKAMLKTSPWGCWGLSLAACTRKVPGAARDGGSRRVRGRPRKEGVPPALGAGLLAGSVLPTGWGQELTRHRMSFLVAGQCVHGPGHQGGGDRWLWMPPSCAAAGKGITTGLGP